MTENSWFGQNMRRQIGMLSLFSEANYWKNFMNDDVRFFNLHVYIADVGKSQNSQNNTK